MGREVLTSRLARTVCKRVGGEATSSDSSSSYCPESPRTLDRVLRARGLAGEPLSTDLSEEEEGARGRTFSDFSEVSPGRKGVVAFFLLTLALSSYEPCSMVKQRKKRVEPRRWSERGSERLSSFRKSPRCTSTSSCVVTTFFRDPVVVWL